MLNKLNLYNGYFNVSIDESTDLKLQRLQSCITEGKVYKFICFDNNEELNNIKLTALKNNQLWFSHYIYLNDKREFQIKYSIKKVQNKTNRSPAYIHNVIETIKELYDVCSFSYECNQNMWNDYSNNGSGICLVFDVNDYDQFFPVDYIDKWKIDYTKLIINSLKRRSGIISNDPMAILPFVTKDPTNGSLDSTAEKEVRILFPSFDVGNVNEGYVYPGVKEKLGYKGCNVSYEDCKISLHEIIKGENCNKNIEERIKLIAKENGISVK